MFPLSAVTAVPEAEPILQLANVAPLVPMSKVMFPPLARMLLYLNWPSVGPVAVITMSPPPVAAIVEINPEDQLLLITPNELVAVEVPVIEIAVPLAFEETMLDAALTVPP